MAAFCTSCSTLWRIYRCETSQPVHGCFQFAQILSKPIAFCGDTFRSLTPCPIATHALATTLWQSAGEAYRESTSRIFGGGADAEEQMLQQLPAPSSPASILQMLKSVLHLDQRCLHTLRPRVCVVTGCCRLSTKSSSIFVGRKLIRRLRTSAVRRPAAGSFQGKRLRTRLQQVQRKESCSKPGFISATITCGRAL